MYVYMYYVQICTKTAIVINEWMINQVMKIIHFIDYISCALSTFNSKSKLRRISNNLLKPKVNAVRFPIIVITKHLLRTSGHLHTNVHYEIVFNRMTN